MLSVVRDEIGHVPTLLQPARSPAPSARPDEVQQAAIEHRGAVLRILGAPGSGKSWLATRIVAERVAGGELAADACLILAPSRLSAARLRDDVTAAVGGTTSGPLARSMQSLAFGLIRRSAALRGEPAPRLITGPEQDVILAELLAGHAAEPGLAPAWPAHLELALPTKGFRSELRDLLMRAVELGLSAQRLADLGAQHGQPEWVAAAAVLAEYDEVTALRSPGSFDPAWILGAAAEVLLDPADEAQAWYPWRLVVVDDAHELTPAGIRLLHALGGAGAQLVFLGDPDSATQTFRGADPGGFIREWPAAAELSLPTAYRTPSAVRAVTARVAEFIGVSGEAGHRAAPAGRAGGRVAVHVLRSPAQEAALIAGRMRQAHLHEDVAWSEMAVIVRGRSRSATIRRVLAANGVPVSSPPTDRSLQEQAAVRPFLQALRIGTAPDPGEVEADTVVDLLQSVVGGADPVMVRRLRRSLRSAELAAGGRRSSDALLIEGVLLPEVLAEIGPEATSARRVGRVLAAARSSIDRDPSDVEGALWAMWQASGRAQVWRAAALAGGAAGARADRDLDAMMRLFETAARHVDRLPGGTVVGFLERLSTEDLPGDSLAASAPDDRSVSVLTPAAAAGRQWRLTAVAGVQEGVWPDLRVRGSLLGSGRLVDVVLGRDTGGRAAQVAVRHDETRLFLVAVSRSSEELLVTAVRSEDEQPSALLELVDPRPADEPRPLSDVAAPATLAGLVGELRRAVVGPDPRRRGAAVTTLARLAAAGVPGADPAGWWILTPTSDERPRRADGIPVAVSPSRVESFSRCQVRWLLQSHGGEGVSIGAADIGRLVHAIAHELAEASESELVEAVRERWHVLGMPPGWLSDRKQREAERMVARFARHVRESGEAGWRRVASEVAMDVALGRAVVRGQVDRLEADPQGRLRVIDLKTGSSKPSVAEVARHPQLGAYQLAVDAGAFSDYGSGSAGAALLQLGKAAKASAVDLQVQSPLSQADDPTWARQLVQDTAQGMAGAAFMATPGEACATCPLTGSCPARPEGRVLA